MTGSGIEKKLSDKFKALKQLGHSVDVVYLAHEEKTASSEDARFISIKRPLVNKRKYFNSFYENLAAYHSLDQWLKKNADSYDAAIFRYPLSSRGLLQVAKNNPGKIVFEHNTKEIEELALDLEVAKKRIPFSVKPGFFLYYFETVTYPMLAEKYIAPRVFKNALGGVGVTNEITTYEKKRQPRYRVKTISNGIDVRSQKEREAAAFDGKELRLFMLVGYQAPWHGEDRIISGLKNYKGPCHIVFDIIGKKTDQKQISGPNFTVNFLPAVNNADLDELLKNYHISVGTLAAHRKEIAEATPLKVRECVSRGFPILIAYKDNDLSNHEGLQKYILNLPANDSVVDMEKILVFAHRVLAEKDHPHQIRRYALEVIDVNKKMAELVEFIKELKLAA